MRNYNKKYEEIIQCLQCPIFKQSLTDYIYSFYEYWEEYKRNSSAGEIGDFANVSDFEHFKRVLASLAEILLMNVEIGTIKEATTNSMKLYDITEALGNFSIKNRKVQASLFPKSYDCACMLNRVLPLIIGHLHADQVTVQTVSLECLQIFDAMERVAQHGVVDRKVNKYTKNSFGTATQNFSKIIEDYARNDIEYLYCNPNFLEFTNHPNLRDCQGARIQSQISKNYPKAQLDLSGLLDSSKAIVYEYLKAVPEAFGENLSRIKKIQGMTDNDLAQILEMKPNAIQSLCKCKTHEKSDNDIKKLARALLVSADVLCCGNGFIYGNWKDLLQQDTEKSVQKTLNENSRVNAKNKIRDIIRGVIDEKETYFAETLEHGFFSKRPCCLYLKDGTDNNSYDYNEMYQSALRPEYVDILISVLRNNQSSD